MLRRFTHEVAAFFRTAIFWTFLQDKTGPVSARFVLAVFAIFATSNALAGFALANLTHRAGDLVQNHAAPGEVKELVPLFIAIFVWFLIIEPLQQVGKLFVWMHWVNVAVHWYGDLFAKSWGMFSDSPPPQKIAERIADRVPELIEAWLELYCASCRAVVILFSFGWMAITLSAQLHEKAAAWVPGWLLLLLFFTCTMETLGAAWLGRKLPDHIEDTRIKKGDYRTMLEDFERIANVRLSDRMTFREKTSAGLRMWVHAYSQTIPPTFRLAIWKSGNQQVWQFILLAGLMLLAADGWFTFGVAAATTYAINELRGALLTFANSWPIITKMQSHARGLRDVEQYFEKSIEANVVQIRDAAE